MYVDVIARVLNDLQLPLKGKVLALHEGQVLTAKVLDFVEGKVILQMGGEKMIAEKEIPLAKGQELEVRVKSLAGEKIVLQMVQHENQPQDVEKLIIPVTYYFGDSIYRGELLLREEEKAPPKGHGKIDEIRCILAFNTINLGLIQAEVSLSKSKIKGTFIVSNNSIKNVLQEKFFLLSEQLNTVYNEINLHCIVRDMNKSGFSSVNGNTGFFDVRV